MRIILLKMGGLPVDENQTLTSTQARENFAKFEKLIKQINEERSGESFVVFDDKTYIVEDAVEKKSKSEIDIVTEVKKPVEVKIKKNPVATEKIIETQTKKAEIVENSSVVESAQEESLLDLEKIVSSVIGKEYLEAFVFGVKTDYDKYIVHLQNNSGWRDLGENSRRELLEKGVAFYVDEILDENEKAVDIATRKKIYKYIFTILNK